MAGIYQQDANNAIPELKTAAAAFGNIELYYGSFGHYVTDIPVDKAHAAAKQLARLLSLRYENVEIVGAAVEGHPVHPTADRIWNLI